MYKSTHFSDVAYVHLTCVHRPHCGSSNGASAAEKSGALHGQATGSPLFLSDLRGHTLDSVWLCLMPAMPLAKAWKA